jgi:hypothetical protein
MATMAAPIAAVVGTTMAATAVATGLNAAAGLSRNLPESGSAVDVVSASEEERLAQEPDTAPLPTGPNDLA